MNVLIDVEWVENYMGKISVSQVAMARVDEKWNPVDRFYSRIAPRDYTFHIWDHVGYTGGTPEDFLSAPTGTAVFAAIRRWLRPDDKLCWWIKNAKGWFSKAADLPNKNLVLCQYVSDHIRLMGQGQPHGNVYQLGSALGVSAPGPQHHAANDVEMMLRLFAHVRLPTYEELHNTATRISSISMPYIVHIQTNTIHKNGCTLIPETGEFRGYCHMSTPVGKGHVPCQCMKKDYAAARRERNQNIIDRSQYNYLYSPDSKVFHRRSCHLILSANRIMGSVYYNSCAVHRQPCKLCKPTYPALKPVPVPAKKSPTPPKATSQKTVAEQRAINRYNQAIAERKAAENHAHLSQEKRDSLFTLSTPTYVFFAAKGYCNFHLRNCKKLSGLLNLKGFSTYEEATRSGHKPCKCCKPSDKHDITVALPIYTTHRTDDSPHQLEALCRQQGYLYERDSYLHCIETEVGLWRVDDRKSPYRLEHINLAKTPNNRTSYHVQPRIFLSLTDAFYYIKRHDDKLTFVWQGTEYAPAMSG